VLIEELEKGHEFVAFSAAKTLGAIGPGARAAVPALLKKLNSPSYAVAAMSASALRSIGPTAVPGLTKALKDKDGKVRETVAGILGDNGARAKDALPALTEALKDEVLAVRLGVMVALCKIDRAQAKELVPRLGTMVADKDAETREAAIKALGDIGPAAELAIPALGEALKNKERLTCLHATFALARIGPAAVPVLSEALTLPDADVRKSVMDALGEIGPQARAAVPPLRDALTDPDLVTRVHAAAALGRIDPTVPIDALVADLVKDLRDPDKDVSSRAADYVGQIGPTARAAVPALVEILKKGSPALREKAVEALDRIGPAAKEAVPALIEALRDRETDKRLLADLPRGGLRLLSYRARVASALGSIGPDARAAVPALLKVRKDDDMFLANAAYTALDKIDPDWSKQGPRIEERPKNVPAAPRAHEDPPTAKTPSAKDPRVGDTKTEGTRVQEPARTRSVKDPADVRAVPPPSAEERKRREERDRLWKAATPLIEAGKSSEAMPLLKQLEKLFTPHEQRLIREQNRLMGLATRSLLAGKHDEYCDALEKALAIEREVFGDSVRAPDFLKMLAENYEGREQFAGAVKARRGLADLAEKQHGKDHPEAVAARLTVDLLQRQARMDRGQRQRLEEAFTAIEQADKLYQKGQYRAGLAPMQQARGVFGELLGEDHPLYARTLNDLGLLYHHLGDNEKAEPLLRRALDIRKRALGENHPEYETSLSNLAALYEAKGEFKRAEGLYLKALEVKIKEDDPSRATTRNNLGMLYFRTGDYVEAQRHLHRAAEVWQKTLGERDPQYAAALNNLAALYHSMGDDAKALAYLQRALELLPGTHPSRASSLNNLAVVHFSAGDFTKAKPLLLEAVQVLEESGDRTSSHYATCLNNLAMACQNTGERGRAKELYLASLKVIKDSRGENDPSYAQTLSNLGELTMVMGEYVRADPFYRQATEIIKRSPLGENHPSYVISLNNLALAYLIQGQVDRAEPLLKQSMQLSRGRLDLVAAAQSERQQLAMTESLRKNLDSYLNVAAVLRERAAMFKVSEEVARRIGFVKVSDDALYAQVLAWKGAVWARQLRMRVARANPELAEEFARLETVAGRLASLAFSWAASGQREEHRRELADLTEQKERLEAALAARSEAFRKQRAGERLTPAGLAAALPPGTALVDFLEYGHLHPRARLLDAPTYERRFVAFIVRPGLPVVLVDLGAVGPITGRLAEWRKTWANPRALGAGQDPGAELRKLVWQPLEAHLKDATTVLISPDGALAKLPFPALPGAGPNTYLVEETPIALVPVPQLLPELLARAEPGGAGRPKPCMLLVGGVDFDGPPGRAPAQPAGPAAPRARGGDSFREFSALPATRPEVAGLEKLFKQHVADGRVEILEGDRATKAVFRRLAPEYRYLHLATHGFFAPEEFPSALRPGHAGPVGDLFGQAGVIGFHPGLLAGIALTGANRPAQPGQDEGILTALEVAQMDLGGVDLAVLSACETGLGEAAGGEGLLGLQRAFQVSGARTVVASLWKVHDNATQAFMQEFYRNLLVRKPGMGKLEALRQAQLTMIARYEPKSGQLRAGGEIRPGDPEALRKAMAQLRTQGRLLPPEYWAAFTLSGDWR
jgi:CHAT domain-containing protein/tetratricopeptide (TPR) repeat protein